MRDIGGLVREECEGHRVGGGGGGYSGRCLRNIGGLLRGECEGH